MTLYQKPFHYTLSHVATGFMAAYYTWVGVVAIIYQLTQLILNVRFFPAEWKILPGNSIEHTLLKLTEIFVGYIIGTLFKNKS